MNASTLAHEAFFYRSPDEYVSAIRGFVQLGSYADEPVLIAVPGQRVALLREALAHQSGRVQFLDMARIGRNPARIIPAIQAFVDTHSQWTAHFVGEPIWPGRSEDEIAEAVRHEALINYAFARARARVFCPYDATRLDSGVLADAERTHPHLVADGSRRESDRWADPLDVYAAADRPLPEPTGPVETFVLGAEPAQIRHTLKQRVRVAGLDEARSAEFLLAANEAVSNTLAHADGRGAVRLWHDDAEVVCEVADDGRVNDPLAGRRAPTPDSDGGRGLWLINQLCDLAELRSGEDGTVVRIHMRLD